MARRSSESSGDDLFERLKALTRDLPPEFELHHLLLTLDDPANDEASKDRYVALVAGGAVDEALRMAIEGQGKRAPQAFDARIKMAERLQQVTSDEAVELHKLRLIRNAFAHSLMPIGFDHPAILKATKGLWAHPVSDWAGYFAPAFAPRRQYAIVCGEFFRKLAGPSFGSDLPPNGN